MSPQERRHGERGVALAERLDIFILYRGRHGRPPERLALTRAEIDALYLAVLLERHHQAPPTYRGFPVVVQGDRHAR